MRLREILSKKGRGVVTVTPEQTVLSAMRVLVEHRIGAVPVLDEDGRPCGILSERDVLRIGSRDPALLENLQVREIMTRELIVCGEDTRVHEAMGLMTEHRVRHLPVVGEEGLEGIVSIGDLLKACHQEAAQENLHLRSYIQGVR
ncbi:MAG: CBS domain-containing protein [Gemmatimonadota bacterium]